MLLFSYSNTFDVSYSSDGSDSDRQGQYRNKSEMGKKPRGRAPHRILGDLSQPPRPVSPLSSPSSISSPVRRPLRRSSRSSSQNSSSRSSTPRSVIKTPSPLPTTHNRQISSSSEEDVKQPPIPEPPSHQIKSRKQMQKVQKSHVIRKSPYISDSDSDVGTKSENKANKIPTKTAAKKREIKKVVRPRSISSSSNFSSPERAQLSSSPTKVKPKKGSRKAKLNRSPPKAQKEISNESHDLKTETKETTPFPSASSILHAPTLLSPMADSPPSSPGSNSFDRKAFKTEEFANPHEDEDEHFLQPSSPLRPSRRQRHTSKQSNPPQKSPADHNILNHHQTEKQLTQDTNESKASHEAKVEYRGEDALEKLLQDDQYYPVQENHMDFIPITKFNDDYAEFLLVLQVIAFVSPFT